MCRVTFSLSVATLCGYTSVLCLSPDRPEDRVINNRNDKRSIRQLTVPNSTSFDSFEIGHQLHLCLPKCSYLPVLRSGRPSRTSTPRWSGVLCRCFLLCVGNAPTLLSLKQLQQIAPIWMNTSMNIFNDVEANKVRLLPLTDTCYCLYTSSQVALEWIIP